MSDWGLSVDLSGFDAQSLIKAALGDFARPLSIEITNTARSPQGLEYYEAAMKGTAHLGAVIEKRKKGDKIGSRNTHGQVIYFIKQKEGETGNQARGNPREVYTIRIKTWKGFREKHGGKDVIELSRSEIDAKIDVFMTVKDKNLLPRLEEDIKIILARNSPELTGTLKKSWEVKAILSD